MRHYNSPDERAKRGEDSPEAAKPPHRGFLHYNHPDEIAKREREGARATAVVVPPRQPRRVVEAEGWPPPGQENTAMVATSAPVPRKRPLAPLSGEEPQKRLELLEELVYALLDTPSEAREFRMHMSNFVAVVESQRDLIARVRALEGTVQDLLDKLGDDVDEGDDDDADDDEPADGLGPARAGDTEPPPGEPAEPSPDAPTKPTTEPTT